MEMFSTIKCGGQPILSYVSKFYSGFIVHINSSRNKKNFELKQMKTFVGM